MPEIKSTGGATQAIAASALRAQQARMRVIAENLANANSTSRIAGGDPYRRQTPVLRTDKMAVGTGVKLARVEPDRTDFRTEYSPGHPSADAKGYVKLPNVDTLVEAMDMRDAQRAYEANLNMIETVRSMDMRTLDLLKK